MILAESAEAVEKESEAHDNTTQQEVPVCRSERTRHPPDQYGFTHQHADTATAEHFSYNVCQVAEPKNDADEARSGQHAKEWKEAMEPLQSSLLPWS